MNLVIVESPAKAKTIEGFLGKDFTVKSSFGHVRDLPKKQLSIDVNNNFLPDYQISPDKKEVVKELKKLADKAEIVWLATDEDREGEAISWHLFEALKLKEAKTKRIVFNEITKTAILKAIENPRKIDKQLVDAQQARRILDRLVGFELSPILWRKVKPSLSAGRVQSVAVRLIVDRERDIENFKSESFFKVAGKFINVNKEAFSAELNSKPKNAKEAKSILESLANSSYTIKSIETKPSKRTPSAPFTTSTLQQEASRKLGFSVAKTMLVAQHLYESGKITYMRTDSVNISETATNDAAKAINDIYGANYSFPRKFTTKSKGAQEAHEAIRPTYLDKQHIEGDGDEERLYDLIWKRTIASQMADAQIDKTVAIVQPQVNTPHHFIATGEMIRFDGFMKVYKESNDNEEEDQQTNMLPTLKVNEVINNEFIEATERFTYHPPRYTEASLVKKLEENGIGRPSTYAPTIRTIQDREYVVKESREGNKRNYAYLKLSNGKIEEQVKTENTGAEKNKLFPTDIGMVVNDYLVLNFGKILDYNFTANVEKEFDDIADGQLQWNKMIEKFYTPFHATVETAKESSESAKGEKLLGVDPATGKNIFVKIAKWGPVIQLGNTEDEEKPKFTGLLKGMTLSNVTLEQALFLLSLPIKLGIYNEKPLELGSGRFGPYVKYNSKFYSVKSEKPLTDITKEEAIQIILEKDEADRNKLIKEFEADPPIKILNGRWGPYINIGKENYKIPKDKVAEELTKEECIEISKAPVKKSNFKKKKK